MSRDLDRRSRASQGPLAPWAYASPARQVEGRTDLAQPGAHGDPLRGSGEARLIRVQRHAAPS
jgi:hypothetical protein